MEEALSYSTQIIEEIQEKKCLIFSESVSNMASQMKETHKKIDHLEEATLNLERYSRSFNLFKMKSLRVILILTLTGNILAIMFTITHTTIY